MKKGTKIWIIIAILLGVLGSVLCVSAFGMGLSYKDLSGMASKGLFHADQWWDDDHYSSNHTNKKKENHSGTQTYAYDELRIDLDFGRLTVKSTDQDQPYLEVDDSKDVDNFKLDIKEGYVKVSGQKHALWSGLNMPSATLYLPETFAFGSVLLDIDAAECSIQTAIDSRKLYADVDAGEVSVQKMHVDWLEFDCDAGSIFYQGQSINGGTIDVDAGKVEIQIDGKGVDAYNYDIEVEAGTLKINEMDYSGLEVEKYISNQKDAAWNINCDVGDVHMLLNE